MESISKTELIIAAILLPVTIAIAVFLNPIFKAPMIKELNVYRSALKNYDDPNLFGYEKETNSGNVLAYGEVESITPVSIPELTNPYSIIVKITQRYTHHTRQVPHQSCTGSGKSRSCTTYYTTEHYYSWDSNRVEKWNTKSFKFLGAEFKFDELDFSDAEEVKLNKDSVTPQYHGWIQGNYLYDKGDKWANEGDLRFYYRYLPLKFNSTIFFRFMDDKVMNPVNQYRPSAECFYEKKPEAIMKALEDNISSFDYWYYPLWVIAVECIWLGLAYTALEIGEEERYSYYARW